MKIVRTKELEETERDVQFTGGHSLRILLEKDKMGFTMCKTIIPKGGPYHWHYPYHLEACYCIKGKGELVELKTRIKHFITPDCTYVLNEHDDHTFEALEDVILISIFNPPLTGREKHDKNGHYPKPEHLQKQDTIRNLVALLANEINELTNVDEKISVLNEVRQKLHEVSPFKHHPVDCVIWEKSNQVEANEYNPNAIPPPEMLLLYQSIKEDGYTMPIVTFKEQKDGQEITKIVDGFHRRQTERNHSDISESTLGYVPITDIRKTQYDLSNRMASTIRHNRARGVHNIELMSGIVAELVEMGKGDAWICKHIGMSQDELLRLKQITGLAALFNNRSFSDSWEVEEKMDMIYD